MAGRGRMAPRHAFLDGGRRPVSFVDVQDGPPFPRGPPPSAVYEEEIDLQRAEMRRLAAENRRLAEDRMGMQREVAIARDEIHRFNVLVADIRTEKEVQIRDLIEKGMKMEADLRAMEPLRKEAAQLRAEVHKLTTLRQEQVQGLKQELSRAQVDAQKLPALKGEIDGLRQEIVRVRTAFEYEKKGNIELLDQRQAMEKNMVSMARELEKLRAEFASGETRTWKTVGGTYGMKLGSPEGSYPSYGDGFGVHSGVADKAPLYGVGSGAWGAYEKSRLPRR